MVLSYPFYQTRAASSPALQSPLDEDSSWTSPATEDTATMPGTPTDLEDDVVLTSTEVSPMRESFSTIRQREIQAEAANTLMYQKPPFRRRSSTKPRPDSPLEHNKRNSITSLLPWSCPVPTRKISVSSTTSRPGIRRASTVQTGEIHADGSPADSVNKIKRRPSQLSIRMRRESVAEKTKIQETLLASPKLSPRSARDLRSPNSALTIESHWSPDNSENEGGEEEEEMMPAQYSTARRVSRADSQMLPIFVRASRVTKEDLQSRRASNFSHLSRVTSVGSHGPTTEKTELVRLVTALQATHLDETRRLHEIIAGLSTKVAALERDLLYSTPSPSSSANSPLNATFPPAAYLASPRGSEVRWRTTAAYRLDKETGVGAGGLGNPFDMRSESPHGGMRRLSTLSSSPRTAAMGYI
ncbi:protein of unknown function [Taphrina deformans PYCC 5710]|uniref:Uncharacterized protein n=1 Tax=Taphrina deformans (strain PYCC 5710 / ATCC 11124 / CBS 356.35 / IMI 108563 / JCM 9778 / NBRC 8474) TaxID=1097556 RepID=R4XPF7_TAPDE|nr:protein of unknown function [Taphrina deformans PYCC 5710]|eukprot:CCG85111.1 protein of unknown function [Taphrina deformans PYCC 5710]